MTAPQQVERFVAEALAPLLKEGATGSVTVHLKDGRVMKVETYHVKRYSPSEGVVVE